MNQPNGIAGLTGREPVGAVLTIGTKGEKGQPTDRDRFYIKLPTMDGEGRRQNHPHFNAFNMAAPADRQAIRGNIVHAKPEQAANWYLRAHKLPGLPSTPKQEPACTGNGHKAMRYLGPEKGFVQIDCPNELCQFRQQQAGPTPCKPFLQLLFRPRWAKPETPAPLFKLTSQSWNSAANLAGFFEHIKTQADQLGIRNPNLFGLPFVIYLSEKSQPAQKRKFPVLTFAVDGDLIAFFSRQREDLKALGAVPRVAALTDDDMQDAELIAEDVASITPGAYAPRQIGAGQ